MSEIKAKQMTEAQIKTLSEYEDKLQRALNGDTIALNSVAAKRLENIHFEVFGVRQNMIPCCGGMRTTAARLTPLAKAYFEQAPEFLENEKAWADFVEETGGLTLKATKPTIMKKDSDALIAAEKAARNASAHLKSVKTKAKARKTTKKTIPVKEAVPTAEPEPMPESIAEKPAEE